jgi:cellulase/cellobiase CelA1
MLYGKTRRMLDHLEKLGAATLNTSSFPIIEVPLAEADQLDRVGALLFQRGIYTTLAFYPGVRGTRSASGSSSPSPTPATRSTSCWSCWTSWPTGACCGPVP